MTGYGEVARWFDGVLKEEIARRKSAGQPAGIAKVLQDLGLNVDTVYRMRRGDGPFSQATIKKVADAFGVDAPHFKLAVAEGSGAYQATQLGVLGEIQRLAAQLEEMIMTGKGGPKVNPSAVADAMTADEGLRRAAAAREKRQPSEKKKPQDTDRGKKPA